MIVCLFLCGWIGIMDIFELQRVLQRCGCCCFMRWRYLCWRFENVEDTLCACCAVHTGMELRA